MLTLISTRFAAGAQRNRAFAVWGTAGGGGMVLGSLAGGILTEWFGWTSVFFVNVPIAVGVIVVSLRVITADLLTNLSTGGRARSGGYDIGGAITATAGCTLAVLGLVQASQSGTSHVSAAIVFALGVVLLAGFVIIERRASDPLVPSGLLRHRNLSAGMMVTGLYMASFGTVRYFLTLYFQNVRSFTALQTRLAFLAPMVGIVAGAQLGGRLIGRWGARVVMTLSMAIGCAGVAALALQLGGGFGGGQPGYLALVPALVVLGLGQGSGWTVMFAGSTTGLDETAHGTASGLVSTAQQIGGAGGLAVLVAISTWAGGPNPSGLIDGVQTAESIPASIH